MWSLELSDARGAAARPRLAPQPGWGGDNGLDSCGAVERSTRHVSS
jgi:hypothetical protein